MRMWMVDPSLMCRKHLLGEHVELHMIVGSINKGRDLSGYTESGLIDTKSLSIRHEHVSIEMMNRGYNHQSPLPVIGYYEGYTGGVDVNRSINDLSGRCTECRSRICGGKNE